MRILPIAILLLGITCSPALGRIMVLPPPPPSDEPGGPCLWKTTPAGCYCARSGARQTPIGRRPVSQDP